MRRFGACLAILFFSLACAAQKTGVTIQRGDVFGRAVSRVWRQGRQIHLLYNDSGSGNIYYLASRDDGLSWQRPVLLSRGRLAEDAQILGDAAGKLYVFFASGGAIYGLDSLDSGYNWSEPYKISGKFTRSRQPCAVLTGMGDIHIVWENAGMIMHRSYAQSAATWSSITDLSNEACTKPLIMNYQNSTLYAVWLQQGEVVARVLDLSAGRWGG